MKEKSNIISTWLFSVCALVFVMVIVGAITRLTDSGLSMVEWRPLIGALPPLSEAEWLRVFNLYKSFPEYEKVHFWMDLSDFKKIFFWEWFHRFLGRFIGLAYALPLTLFWIKGQIPSGYKLKLIGMLVLGGMQGVMGWYMVKSGLVDQPDVSHYRLAAHLSLAFLIIALLLWLGLSIRGVKTYKNKPILIHALIALVVFVPTFAWGAFTAGLDAGLIYNDSFPKMGGQWIPPDMWQHSPAWLNFLQTHSGVQFTHRWLAMLSVVVIVSLWAHAYIRGVVFPAIYALGVMVFIQFGLGVATLMSVVALPIATAHQGGAVIILMLLIVSICQLKSD